MSLCWGRKRERLSFSAQMVPSCDIEEDVEGIEPFLTRAGN